MLIEFLILKNPMENKLIVDCSLEWCDGHNVEKRLVSSLKTMEGVVHIQFNRG